MTKLVIGFFPLLHSKDKPALQVIGFRFWCLGFRGFGFRVQGFRIPEELQTWSEG